MMSFFQQTAHFSFSYVSGNLAWRGQNNFVFLDHIYIYIYIQLFDNLIML